MSTRNFNYVYNGKKRKSKNSEKVKNSKKFSEKNTNTQFSPKLWKVIYLWVRTIWCIFVKIAGVDFGKWKNYVFGGWPSESS